jgi:hypothetical protein
MKDLEFPAKRINLAQMTLPETLKFQVQNMLPE